jgi:hypothetical protein
MSCLKGRNGWNLVGSFIRPLAVIFFLETQNRIFYENLRNFTTIQNIYPCFFQYGYVCKIVMCYI